MAVREKLRTPDTDGIAEFLDAKRFSNESHYRLSREYLLDWRALRRWSISENRLPRGSIVQYRQPTFWEV